MDEQWKIYKDTRHVNTNGALWEVSNYGNVRKNGNKYVPKIGSGGYAYIASGESLHRVVAELFVPKTEEDIKLGRKWIDHIDTNRINNSADNLRWCTYKENANNPITRKKKSSAFSGDKNPMYGKRGELSPNYGVHRSDQFKEAQRERFLGSKNPMYGNPHSEQTKQKMSDSHKKAWENEDYKKYRLEQIQNQDYREQVSQSVKKLREDEEYRNNMIEKRHSEQYINKKYYLEKCPYCGNDVNHNWIKRHIKMYHQDI